MHGWKSENLIFQSSPGGHSSLKKIGEPSILPYPDKRDK